MSKNLPNPTEVELSILRVLWERGPCTVRAVQEALGSQKAYTTVLTVMQTMTEKGFLVPDKTSHAHVYTVSVPAQETQKQMVTDLIHRAFGGAARQLVMHALSSSPSATKKDLDEIERLISKMEKQK